MTTNRRRPRTLPLAALAAVAVAAHAAPLAAQTARQGEAPPLAPPQRVRLVLPAALVVGNVLTAGRDSVLVQTSTGAGKDAVLAQRWVPLACIERAEVSAGTLSRRRAATRYAVLGTVLGGAVGATIARSRGPAHAPRPGDRVGPDPGRLMRENAGGFAAAGAVIGAFIGARRPAERWQRVELPQYRYVIQPGTGAVAEGCAAGS
jgi:hypothetical protein